MAHEIKTCAQATGTDATISEVGRWGYLREAQRHMAEIEAARPKPKVVIEGNPYLTEPTPRIRHTGKVAPLFLGCYG